MNEWLLNLFDDLYANLLGQYWFYFMMAFWMGVNAVRTRRNEEESWRYEVITLFCLGIAAILWQLSR